MSTITNAGFRKVLIAVLTFSLFLQFTASAQSKHPAPAKSKVLPQVQPEAEPPNPYADIDKTALAIPDSLTKSSDAIASYINSRFSLATEKVRAAFIWVATNIRYDVPNMYAINYYEKPEDKIAKPLQTRQGICENYAALFADICQKTGIRCYIVEGYVKSGKQVLNVSHAWCAAQIDSGWYLYDPTWAAGYVNNQTFVPKINNAYYASGPLKFIIAHMPFDPLWQLLNHPIGFAAFNDGMVAESQTGPLFNYPDSISLYVKQPEMARYQASYSRIDNNGPKNAQIFNRLQFIRQKIEEAKTNQYNDAVEDYNRAIYHFNNFIRYRNKQFVPLRPDPEIQAMLDSASVPFAQSKMKLTQIENPGPNITGMKSTLEKQMSDFSVQLKEQEDWLAKYFSKGKGGRKGMFNKITMFGVPLN